MVMTLDRAISELAAHRQRIADSGALYIGLGSYLFVEIDHVVEAYLRERGGAREPGLVPRTNLPSPVGVLRVSAALGQEAYPGLVLPLLRAGSQPLDHAELVAPEAEGEAQAEKQQEDYEC